MVHKESKDLDYVRPLDEIEDLQKANESINKELFVDFT